MRLYKQTGFFVAVVLNFLITGCSEPVHTKQVTEGTIGILEEQFLFSDIIKLASGETDFASIVHQFDANPNKYKHYTSKQQGKMRAEGYQVLHPQSPITDYSFFFYGESQTLVMIDATINPSARGAIDSVKNLIRESFDSDSATGGYRLHYLGIYPLDNKRNLKIGILEAKLDTGSDHAIRYAISVK